MMAIAAACSIDNDATTPLFVTNNGFVASAIAKPGVGIVELVLDRALDPEECAGIVTVRGAAGVYSTSLQHVSDTIKRVHTYLAGVASDAVNFDVVFIRTEG
jgi:hypothetical protein